jgi:septum formation protein
MTRVVLGSASAGRRNVLRQAGIEAMVVVSGVDEDAVIASLGPDAGPAAVTRTLATAKARRVAENLDAAVADDAVVIGCDSMLYRDGRLHGKPESEAAARRQWQLLAGGDGQLHTGHCVIRLQAGKPVFEAAETSVTTVHFGAPSAAELDAYIASGEPLAVAGGFTLDGLGGWFVDAVDGDPSTVIGLGLPVTRRLLGRAGLSIPQLWAANPVGQ